MHKEQRKPWQYLGTPLRGREEDDSDPPQPVAAQLEEVAFQVRRLEEEKDVLERIRATLILNFHDGKYGVRVHEKQTTLEMLLIVLEHAYLKKEKEANDG